VKIQKPYFSIIIPSYNRAKYIVTAIESVLAQTFESFELIIVDDGSQDETASLIAPFLNSGSQVYYIHQENQGRSVARNVGIDAAKGEWVCFLDSDDLWLPNHLANIHKASEPTKEPTFIFTALSYRFPDKQTAKHFPPLGTTKPIDYVIGNQVSTITVAIPRETLSTQKFNPALSINEDLELWARIVADLPILYVDEATAVAVQHDSNTLDLTDDSVTPRMEAMNLVFTNENLKPYYSNEFKNRKRQGLLELRIRANEVQNESWTLIKNLIKFLILYPRALRNRSKVVLLFYALPGGSILKRFIQGSNTSN
jgi:glycosyltransferase involved in cell wall biosynthesis